MTDYEWQMSDEERQEKQRRRQEKDDLGAIMALPEGRRFLCRIVCACGLFGGGMSPTPEVAAFREGQRDMAVWIVEEMFRINPGAAGEILRLEAKEETDE
ncbi:hypothetical protein FACS1894205_5710 [Alphaproteobacteria bacterium]|nr:hypothetical protein FACS1894205_5710 [Alphaproteobacteria bacterium]